MWMNFVLGLWRKKILYCRREEGCARLPEGELALRSRISAGPDEFRTDSYSGRLMPLRYAMVIVPPIDHVGLAVSSRTRGREKHFVTSFSALVRLIFEIQIYKIDLRHS